MITKIEDILEVLKDVRTELSEPEVAELITLALDRKIDEAIAYMEGQIYE